MPKVARTATSRGCTAGRKEVLVAQGALTAAPMLIPVQGGVYIPDDPPEEGNPLFSVYGFDIIFAGETLCTCTS